MKVVLVHDFLTYWGGAERVLRGLHRIFPDAPIYTLFFDASFVKRFFADAVVQSSFLQSYPSFGYRWVLPLMPSAVESLNLSSFDLVISSGAFSKGIITKPHTHHIHYCHSTPRFLWEEPQEYLRSTVSLPLRPLASFTLHWLRIWDKAACQRVDTFVANSQWTAKHIKKIYGKEASIIYPFVEHAILEDHPSPEKKYFLIVSRLKPYKNIDLVIKVFNKIRMPLFIVGEGSDKKRLKRMARGNIKFLGLKSEEHLPFLYRHASALILPSQEDFGLTAIEAMRQGTPVLAYKRGGVCETLIEGKTGEFFDVMTPKNFYDGLRRLLVNAPHYNESTIKKRASRFSFTRFQRQIQKILK